TDYFGASGTGQINAIFPVTAQSGHAVPNAKAICATNKHAMHARL
ncbi:MAG: 3,4-dihydroxyphenylacetate 2,3-dioxygenase, partial [Betaproteobacteria bacterium]|nr:3,4-dihydroxyphenylacetate 2,3-dioxygenase [Betaproteobacteria bacterium]